MEAFEAMTAARKLDPSAATEHDPVWLALRHAPLADEPIPEEEIARAEAAIAEIRSGRVQTVPHAEVHAELSRST